MTHLQHGSKTREKSASHCHYHTAPIPSCITLLKSKTGHFDPGRMAVMVCSRSATHNSNKTRRQCSKNPQSTGKNSWREGKVHRPSPDHFELHFLKSLRELYCQGDCTSIHLFIVVIIRLLSDLQSFPSCSCCSFIASFCGIPIYSTRFFHSRTTGARSDLQRINVGDNAFGISLRSFLGFFDLICDTIDSGRPTGAQLSTLQMNKQLNTT